VLAIDAKYCERRTAWQLRPVMLMRDAAKAYAGFSSVATARAAGFNHVCSGAWGCGIFNGDRYLKFLVQVCLGAKRFGKMFWGIMCLPACM
jgi:poly(ADP-ribose) glycohydrolase